MSRRHIVVTALLLSLFAPLSRAVLPADFDARLAALQGPVTIETKVGRTFTGRPLKVNPDQVSLEAAVEGGGEVQFSFRRDEIFRLRLPGGDLRPLALELAESGETAGALRVTDALFAQRQPFLAFLGESEAAFFTETLPLYRAAARPEAVLRRIEAIEGFVQSPDLRRQLTRERLLAHQLLGHDDAAEALAREWIKREADELNSALGHVSLALLQVRRGEADAAFFTVLQPIVFSGSRRPAFLAQSYHLAILLAKGLGRPEEAAHLVAEAHQRGLTGIETGTDFAPLPPPDLSALNPP